MKTVNEFILAHTAKAIWEHEQNDVFEAIMYAKEKGLCNTEAKLVESAFIFGAAAAMILCEGAGIDDEE